jgi:hypothetical protein
VQEVVEYDRWRTARIKARHGGEYPPELSHLRWDDSRVDAALGKCGIIAQRCAQNDYLWQWYAQAAAHGPVPKDAVRNRLEVDIVRSNLYPPDYRGDPFAPPPPEHVEKLRRTGELKRIQEELRRLGA